jgi:hypothetical protein
MFTGARLILVPHWKTIVWNEAGPEVEPGGRTEGDRVIPYQRHTARAAQEGGGMIGCPALIKVTSGKSYCEER